MGVLLWYKLFGLIENADRHEDLSGGVIVACDR